MNEVDQNDRLVLPQWLSFRQAARQREANVFARAVGSLDYGPTMAAFTEALADFRREPSTFVGTELMGISQVLGEDQIARELAEYVISQPFVGTVADNQAKAILGKAERAYVLDERTRIGQTKKRVREFPRDALAWIEQARLYTITGQRLKARKAVLAALHLAPSDRYIVRAAIRFFVHFHEWEAALHYAKNAYALNKDPLIFGPMLSVATRLEKLPSKLKPAAEDAMAAKNTFLYSETLEAVGTLEIVNGAEKKSRRFFKQAWIDPTKAVVSHSQWVLREHLPNLAEERQFDFSQSPQALSWLRFSILDFRGAVTGTQDWALEEPYSRAPHILGSNAACLVDDFVLAEVIANRGLDANPKDVILINNLAFAQLRGGKFQEAEQTFAPLTHFLDNPEQIAPLATYGLLLMSQGKYAEGSKYYEKAIMRANEAGNYRMAFRATLNFLISSIDITRKVDIDILKAAEIALKDNSDAGCFGAAMAFASRLKKSRFEGSEELQLAAREFTERVALEKPKFLNSIFAKLLPAKPATPKSC